MKNHIKEWVIIFVLILLALFTCEAQPSITEQINFTQQSDGTFVLSNPAYVFYNGLSTKPTFSIPSNKELDNALWNKTLQRIQQGEEVNVQNLELKGYWIIGGCTKKSAERFKDHPSSCNYFVIRLEPYKQLEKETTQLWFTDAQLFPNPVPGYAQSTALYVSKELYDTPGEYFLTIYDFLGGKVAYYDITDSKTLIWTEFLSSGVYYYTVNSRTQTGPKGKFIVL